MNAEIFHEDQLSWRISVPRLPAKLPRRRSIRSEIRFTVKNNSDAFLRVRIKLRSSSRILLFHSGTVKKYGKSRIKKTRQSLSEVVEGEIGSGEENLLICSFNYRPLLTSMRRLNLQLEYLILGLNRDGEEVIHSGPHSLNIPIERESSWKNPLIFFIP